MNQHGYCFVALVVVTCAGCAYNRPYTEWEERTETSRTPVGETHRNDDGTCARDYDVNYEEVGVRREQTENLRSSYIAVGALAAASVGGFVVAAAQSDADRAGQWLLFSLASAGVAVVWGGHTLWVKSSRDNDRTVTNTSTERVRLDDPSCGQDVQLAATGPPQALGEDSERECLDPKLADRKLEQLDDLEAEGLIDEARLASERTEIEATRCPPSANDAGAEEESSPARRLEQLEKLKAQGLISEEEYQRKRQAILDTL